MPVGTCSATAAGPLRSTTQATEGAGLVGSCGAANTAPSGLSAAVTRSAEKGRLMGAPSWSGPVEATGGSVGGVVAVVLEPDVEPWRDEREPVWLAGELEPQAARRTAHDAATMVQCRYGLDFLRTGPVWRAALGATLRPMATTRDISYEADGRSM